MTLRLNQPTFHLVLFVMKATPLNFFFTLTFLYGHLVGAQKSEFLVKPFLQDASPHSIVIKWETSNGAESIVEYGKSPKLGKMTKGKAYGINYDDSRLHEVKLAGLDRLTMYYYRVKTGDLVSDIFQFKTPPFAEDKESFRIAAMSDMQEDQMYPNKFEELINQGLISYLEENYDGTLPDNLALMMIPGDLVQNGAAYHQWKRDFFDPAAPLFSQVPVYPVPGNHENNSVYYFQYFTLPENGTPAYHEHWWYKDYGNVRIIGLDSNRGYTLNHQITWLDQVLEMSASDENIDFVFAQLHHPFKSEMWLDGELDYTGRIVKKLEAFSTATGKPSAHFFGHTHAYSRGQSRDHKHLWINVATAGGNVDYWGEFAQRNYEEFSVTQDEYGFVVVDIDQNNGDPSMTIRRLSRGNENLPRDNEMRDSLTVWRYEKKPATPVIESPKNGVIISNREILLKASDFDSKHAGAVHGAAHWQVSTTEDFAEPVIDRWRQHQDWYADIDRQANDNLTDELILHIESNKNYFWRVRYRDQNLNWSDWSETGEFKVEDR